MAPERPEGEVGARHAVEQVFAIDGARILAVLARDLGDLDLAEDGLQDAFAEALRTWRSRDLPDRPAAWILTTARNRAIDRLRRAAAAQRKVAQLTTVAPDDETLATVLADKDLPDERLRLIFATCHPAIDRKDAVALTLRTVGGLSTREIAAAFLVKETTMQARITRAKAKIRQAGIAFRVPDHHELPERLPTVLDVIALVYNQGYTPHGEAALVDRLRKAAVEMATVLADRLPDEPEALGCQAMLLFHEARQPGRLDSGGRLVALEDQDRSRWDRSLVHTAEPILQRALRMGRPGPFQLQAAISALHSSAATAADTDWPQIVTLYDLLLEVAPSPTVEVARAVAVGMADGPEVGLAALPPPDPPLDTFHRWHAAHADLLRRAGRFDDAAGAFERAEELATNPFERRWLRDARRRDDPTGNWEET